MPLHNIIQHDENTKILIWKITESLNDLKAQVDLQPKNEERLQTIKSKIHQRAFLSVRKLLLEANLSDYDLEYDASGKPYLSNTKTPFEISITHSHEFAGLILSTNKVGIDIELQREKIISIANKFSLEQLSQKDKQKYIRKLTVIWGAKESIFKIKNLKGISFRNHIIVKPFKLKQNKAMSILNFNGIFEKYRIHFLEIENYTLVYVLEKQ